MGPTPFYGARAENPIFAHKANECRLSGDIMTAAAVVQVLQDVF